ncbi:T9SS type A sorting domain-containing protein [Pedobacter arcticus]|uniref:T9SS type A sorting domain-containing protein n=1 Tax=Pedobacter arcticus TaxID=752140 RepID=UPI00036C0037|nr:T9SS type A sorting domain-containing protein [Pedobacter arcticus]
MKKIVQSFLMLMLVAGAAQAQFTPYNRVINVDWNRGASPANDTTAAGVASPSFYEAPNSGDNNRFFPFPSKGDYRLRALSYITDAEFKLSGSVLSIKNGTSGNAKVAVHSIGNSNAIAKFSFTLDLTNFSGANANPIVIALGNYNAGDGSSALTNSSSPFSNADATIFGSFRLILSTTFKTQYKPANGSGQTDAPDNVNLIKPNVSQNIEIFANNTASSINYKYNPADLNSVALTAGKYHIYVNGTRFTFEFPKSDAYVSATKPALNTLSIAVAGNATQETIKLSNLQVTYQAATDPLPVSLTSFTGEKANNGIRLNWKTASELNNDHFDVLRSTEGQTFTTLTSIAGKGTSNQVNTYSYLDNAPQAGTNYYKLKQVDKDGTATVSDIVVAVDGGLSAANAFSANLSNNTLNASFDATATGTASLSLTDLSGRKVFSKSFSATKGLNNISLAAPSLNAGIYVATLLQNGNSKSIKIVK